MWQLLRDKFDQMPAWVQISTYLILLILCIYLYLIPRFANGQIIAKTPNGGLVPYRGVDIRTYVEGRVLKFKSDEDGYWSVPLVSRIPESLLMQVYHEDDSAWHEVNLVAPELWLKDFRIVIKNSPPSIDVELVKSDVMNKFVYSFKSIFSEALSQSAQAAELVVPEELQGKKLNVEETKKIGDTIRSAVSNATGKDPTAISPDDKLRGAGAPSYVQRIQIIDQVERQMNIRIPDEHWRELNTVEELNQYVVNRKLLEESKPEVYKTSPTQSVDWATIQQKAPTSDRAIFRK